MSNITASPAPRRLGFGLPAAVLLLGLVLSLLAWQVARRSEDRESQQRFERRVDDLLREFRTRTHAYPDLLRGAAALFASTPQVSPDAWRAYVDKLEFSQNYPGVVALSYAQRLQPEEASAHVSAMRAHLDPAYTLRPAGTFDEYIVTTYTEPFTVRNRRALGYVMNSEPVRQAALAQARDTGEPTLSGRVHLLSSTDQAPAIGALMVLPVYRQDRLAYTVDERRASLQGYVYCVFRMDTLIPLLIGDQASDLLLEIHDGKTEGARPSQDQLLYASRAQSRESLAGHHPRFDEQRVIRLAGHDWTVRVATLPSFDATLDRSRSTIVLVGGLVTTGLAFVIAWSFVGTRRRALHLAERLTRSHKEAEQRMRAVMDGTADAILTMSVDGIVRSANRATQRIFGYAESELIGLPVRTLAVPQARAELDRFYEQLQSLNAQQLLGRQFDIRGQRKDGSEILLRCTTSLVEIDDQPHVVCMCADVTQQRAADAKAREADTLRQAILSSAPFSVISTDTKGLITAINPAGEKLLGYGREELVGLHSSALIHDPVEIAAAAQQLTSEFGELVPPTIAVFTAKARRGIVEQREWHYIRKDGNRVPVMLTVSCLHDEAGQINGFVGIAQDISERKRTDEYIRHMSMHDKLTGLPNRVLLQEHAEAAIARARRGQSCVGLLLLDLDRFKHINDSLGHHVGDEVLQVVAKRLNECVRNSDTVVRMGGDEFVVLLSDLHQREEAQRIAQKITAALADDLVIGSQSLRVTPSIGIATYPQDGADLSTLLKNADAAMYHAKDMGRNNIQTFKPNMNERLTHRLELEADLSHAVERNELVIHYQPLIDAQSGMISGVEALLRWKHPTRGLVSPADFIPLAEETGLILPIGEWVLRTACLQIKKISEVCNMKLRLAVNLSPRQFGQPSLVEMVRHSLETAKLDPAQLELEITEGVLMRDVEQTLSTLEALRNIGVKLAVDDFGTGFSSLSYLSRFPIHTLKVDRSFVRDIGTDSNNTAIASAVISMAHTLGLRVVAEGVETQEQREFLRARRCDELQGFLFSKPVPVEDLAQRIEDVQAVCAVEMF